MSEEVTKTTATTTTTASTTEERPAPRRRRRKRVVQNLKCPLCESGVKSVYYKDVYQLKNSHL